MDIVSRHAVIVGLGFVLASYLVSAEPRERFYVNLEVSLRVVVLDTALRLSVKEVASAAGGAGGLLAAKERSIGRSGVIPAHSAAPAEENAGNQEAGHSGPCEGVGFDSQLRGVTAASEGIASFDSPCPVTVSGVTGGTLEVDLRH